VKKKLLIFNFLAIFCLFLILPGQTHYETITLASQPTAVFGSHFVVPVLAPIPLRFTNAQDPYLSAPSAYVLDISTGVVLLKKQENLSMLPASTTKMMTALVAMESFSPDQILTVFNEYREGQNLKLRRGETMTVENLLYCLLVASANDAAEVLASNFPGGREVFIQKMNDNASQWGMKGSHFLNPAGIDQEGQYSTSHDLAILAKQLLKNPLLAKIVATKEYAAYSVDGRMVHRMSNINLLLNQYPGVKGIKTGWTDLAGECLVGYVEKDNQKVLSVILGSKDRFGETALIFDWVFRNYTWEKITQPI
jgi:serine-type D-Ala-D-Ala carboxypeptidase (penicillin-binding protein 5/6)